MPGTKRKGVKLEEGVSKKVARWSKKAKTSMLTKITRMVKNQETKYSELNMTATPIQSGGGSAGYVALINTLSEGDEYNQRNGRRISMKYIRINYVVQAPTSTLSQQDYVKLWLVLDRQPNNALTTFATIMDTTSSGLPLDMMKNNAQFRDRFVIAREVMIGPLYCLNDSPNSIGTIFYKVPDKYCDVQYSGAAGGIGTITTNAWLLIAQNYLSTQVTTATCSSLYAIARYAFTET